MPAFNWTNSSTPQWWNLPFPIFQKAVSETEQAIQAPIKMVSHCAANAVFSCVQGLGDFERPDGGIAPLTNISLIIGETGERKSAVDKCFFKEIYRLREECNANEHVDIEHSVRMSEWRIEKKILEKRLCSAIATGSSGRSDLLEILKDHALRQPKPPGKVTFIYQDTSLASLKLGLARFPSACVHSTEGMSILNGALFEEQALLCCLYSGETYLYDRKDKNIALKGRRLCVSAHSQPQRTFAFLANSGWDFRDSGLAARVTFCLVPSNQGYRKHDVIEIPANARADFGERARYLLRASLRAGRRVNFRRRKIRFNPVVAREYLQCANWAESQMLPGGIFQRNRDYANRWAEKIGRFAAAAHLFEDLEGDISMDTFRAAQFFYSQEISDFQYLFDYLPSEQCRADHLMQWLQSHPPLNGEPGLKKSFIEQRCVVSFRRRAALNPPLGLLEQQGKLHLEVINKTIYVILGPRRVHFVPQPAQLQQPQPPI